VKAAIGEDIDNETLGGATTHSEISGVTDYKCKDDADCLKTIRAIVDKLGKPKDAGFSREKPAHRRPMKRRSTASSPPSAPSPTTCAR
jgi:3-methylcrotonyl-CoA carboxylase beta subunit